METAGPNPYAEEQTLNGYIGEGGISVKLKTPSRGQLELRLNAASCSVEVYRLDVKSLLTAIVSCEEWRRPKDGVAWWRLVERAQRIKAKEYEIKCMEGPASLSVKKGVVTLYLPGTISGTANMVYHGWVSSKYVGKTSITQAVHLRLGLGGLRTAMDHLSQGWGDSSDNGAQARLVDESDVEPTGF